MPLILAIEPDSRQASLVSELARGLADVELVLAASAGEGIRAFETRVPDLVLTSTLLSPADESLLTERLRRLDSTGAHVQILVTPLLAESQVEPPPPQTGLLSRLGWRKPKAASTPDGCDPAVFAGQITEYLNRAHVLRRAFIPMPPSSIEEDVPSMTPDPLPEPEVVETAPVPSAGFILLSSPPPALDLFKTEEPIGTDELIKTGEPIKADEPIEADEAEPLVTELDALSAELDAVLAAHAEVVDQVDPAPVEVNEPHAIPEAVEAVLQPDEPVAETRTFRPDLLELLAAIQLDLEPMRSTPGQRSSAHAKPPGSVQDEWGFFDPQQCGMAALLARLDQMAQQRDAGTGRN